MAQVGAPSKQEKDEFQRILSEGDYPAFAANYLKVQTKSRGLQPFELWPIQRELWEIREREKVLRSLILKFRQGGFTRNELGMGFFEAIRHPDYNYLVMGHEKALPTELLDVVRLFIEFMPEWARPSVGRDSAVEIYFDKLRSSIRVGSGATVMEGAGAKLGRTVQRLHVTEASDPRWYDDSFRMLFQTVPIDCEIVVESTPKGARGWFYDEYGLTRSGGSTFRAFFYEWHKHPEYRFSRGSPEYRAAFAGGMSLTDKERELTGKGLTLEQIAFRRNKVLELRGEKHFLELYPEDDYSCFILSGAGYFDTEALRHQLETEDCIAGAVGLRGGLRRDLGGVAV